MPGFSPCSDSDPARKREIGSISETPKLTGAHKMSSPLTEAMIVNGIVLATVLATDLGPARKIGPMRLLRPVIAAAVIIPLFVDSPVTHGTGLVVEIAGTVAGLLVGLAAAALMTVYRSPKTGRPVSRAGWPYALLWTVVVGARAAFSYGSAHWFQYSIVSWAIANQVTEARSEEHTSE